MSKEYKKIIAFHLVLNLIFALFISSSSYYHTPLSGFKDRLMYVAHLCILQSTFAGFLYFLSLSKVLFKLFFPILFLVLGFIAFWVYSVDISVSSYLFDISFNTNLYIVKDLISFALVLYVLVLICGVYFLLKLYNRLNSTKGVLLFTPLSILLIATFFYVNKKRGRTLSSKLPYSFFYAINDYALDTKLPLGKPANINRLSNTEKIKVVFVIGESVRSDHLQINGYTKNTTPLLKKQANVLSFRNTYTNKTYTIVSVPQLLTNESIYNYQQKDSLFSLFSVLNKLNISTSWFGNQLLEYSYKSIVQDNKKVSIIDKLGSFNSFHKKHDLELIPYVKKELNVIDEGLISVHMIGSHWYYDDKYTEEFRKYKPVNDSKYIPSQTKEQMINSYDNTILYLDNFLNEIIKELKKEKLPTVLVYSSDHGEALGENGKWLHSHRKSLENPAMLVWYSDIFKEKFPQKVEALLNRKNEFITTDVIYHSILDLFQINNFDKQQSIFYCEP